MKKIYLCTIGFLSLFVLLPVANAQNEAPSAENVFVLPSVYVRNIKVQAEGNSVKGSFEAYNGGDTIVGGLTYDILVMTPRSEAPVGQIVADNAIIFSRTPVAENFSVIPNETKRIDFSVDVGSLPKENYRVRAQLKTVGDRELGWDDAAVVLGEKDANYAVIGNPTVEVESTDPITKEKKNSWQSLEGPNVDAGGSLSVAATVKNLGKAAITFKPELESVRILATSDKDSTKKAFQGETVTLKAGGEQKVSVPVVAQDKPGAYAAFLKLVGEDGKEIASNQMEYRYVVRGISVSVLDASVTELPTKVGEVANVSFTLAGSADRETALKGKVEASLVDNGEIIGSATTDFSLETGARTGKAHIILKKDLCHNSPSLVIKASDDKGNVLEEYKANLNTAKTLDCSQSSQAVSVSENKTGKTNPIVWIVLVIVVLAVATPVLIKLVKIKKTLLIVLAVLGISGAFFATNFNTNAASSTPTPPFQFYETSGGIDPEWSWAIYFNKPGSTQSLLKNAQTMEYDLKFTWSACNNVNYQNSSNTAAFIRSGHLNKTNYSGGTWTQIGSRVLNVAPTYQGPGDWGSLGYYILGATVSYYANFSLPSPLPINSQNESTLQSIFNIIGKNTPLSGCGAIGCTGGNLTVRDLRWLNFDLNPPLSCVANSASVNINSPVTFTASGGNSSGTTSWFYPTTATSASATNQSTFTVTPTTPGVNYVRVTKGTEEAICSVNVINSLQCQGPTSGYKDDLLTFWFTGGIQNNTATNSWQASGGNPNSGNNASFTTKFSNIGNKTVTLTQSHVVTPAPTPPTPVPTPTPATVTPAPEISSWNNPMSIVSFVNSKASRNGFNSLPRGSALKNTQENAQKVCNLAGYSTVENRSCRYVGIFGWWRCGFIVPFLHQMASWNSNTNKFDLSTGSWSGNYEWLSSLTCSGQIGIPATIPSESPATPVTSPTTVTETASCQVAITQDSTTVSPPTISISSPTDSDGYSTVDPDGKATITWTTTGITGVDAGCMGSSENGDIDWNSTKGASGTQKTAQLVAPGEYTYVLGCENLGGEAENSVTIKIKPLVVESSAPGPGEGTSSDTAVPVPIYQER